MKCCFHTVGLESEIMCQLCERRQDIKFGWEQPEYPDIHGNVVKELELKAVIHDYKTATPEMIITMPRFFPDLIGTDGVASVYIPIHYCPNCGRELGKREEAI